MKGLIIKDFINLRSQMKIIACILLIYIAVAASSQQSDLITMMLLLFCIMLPITSFAYDEVARWERYALAMPLSRRDLVLSKYIVSWLVLGGFILLSCGVQAFFIDGWLAIGSALCLQVGIALWFIAIILPLLFRFGSEKGRMMLILVFALIFFFLFLWEKIGGGLTAQVSLQYAVWLLPLSGIIGEMVSILCSIRIYQQKEIQ